MCLPSIACAGALTPESKEPGGRLSQGQADGQRLNALGMHVTVEQANEQAVNLSIREGLLLRHRRVLRIVVVGETIRGSPARDNGLMRFGKI
jgi:hypothetical protein